MARNHRIKSVPGTTHRTMELLLAENVSNLGQQGEIVRVRAGYGRNFLLPQGLATIATDGNKRAVDRHRKRQEEARVEQMKSWRALADAVGKYSVTLEANANKDGHLYGSILAADISAQLKNAKFAVSPDHIKLEGPLKETGMYTVRVQFTPEIETEVKVWVVPKAGAQPPK